MSEIKTVPERNSVNQNTPAREGSTVAPSAALTQIPESIAGARITGFVDSHRINSALTEAMSERYGLSAILWASVVSGLIKVVPSPSLEQRRQVEYVEALLNQVVAEKRKQRKESDEREAELHAAIAKLIGQETADRLAESIKKIATQDGPINLNNPAVAADLATEISSTLAATGFLNKLGVAPSEMTRLLSADLVAYRRNLSNPLESLGRVNDRFESLLPPASDLNMEVILKGLQVNPRQIVVRLQNADGARALIDSIQGEPSFERVVSLLEALRDRLAPAELENILRSTRTFCGMSLFGAALEAATSTLAEEEGRSRHARIRSLIEASPSISQIIKKDLELAVSVDVELLAHFSREELQAKKSQIQLSLEEQKGSFIRILQELDPASVDALVNSSLESVKSKAFESIQKRYPKLASPLELDKVEAGLNELGASTELSQFVIQANNLGVSEEPSRMQSERELAVRISTYLREVISSQKETNGLERAIKSLEADFSEGSLVGFSRLREIYGGLIQEGTFTQALSETNRASIFLRNINLRIAEATDPLVIAELCAERDGIEWRATRASVSAIMASNPSDIQRALDLLTEFERSESYPKGRRGEFIARAKEIKAELELLREELRVYAGDSPEQSVIAEIKAIVKEPIAERLRIAKDEFIKNDQLVKDISDSWRIFDTELNKAKDALKQSKLKVSDLELQLERINAEFAKSAQQETFAEQVNHISKFASNFNTNPTLSRKITEMLAAANRIEQRVCTARLMLERSIPTRIGDALSNRTVSQISSVVGQLDHALNRDVLSGLKRSDLGALVDVIGTGSPIERELRALINGATPFDDGLRSLISSLDSRQQAAVKIFLILHNRPELQAGVFGGALNSADDLWKVISGSSQPKGEFADLEDEESARLSGILDTSVALRRAEDVRTILTGRTPAEIGAALEDFKLVAGRSLAHVLIGTAPLEVDSRRRYLLEIVGQEYFDGNDLRPLFGQVLIPEDLSSRRQLLGDLLRQDAQQAIKVPDELLAFIKRTAEERAALTIALQGGTSEAKLEQKSRLSEIESTYYRLYNAFARNSVGEFNPVMLRNGAAQILDLKRDMLHQLSMAKLLDPNSDTGRRVARVAELISTKQVGAEEILDAIRDLASGDGELKAFESLYRNYVAKYQLNGLSGSLFDDLKRNVGGENLEARLTQLLADSPEAIKAHDVSLLLKAVVTRDSQLAIRGLLAIALREKGAEFEKVLTNLKNSTPEFERWLKDANDVAARQVNEVINAIRENDQVKIRLARSLNRVEQGWRETAEIRIGLANFYRVSIAAAESGISFAGIKVGNYISDKAQQLGYRFDFLRDVEQWSHEKLASLSEYARTAIKDKTFDIGLFSMINSVIPAEQRAQFFKQVGEALDGQKLKESFYFSDDKLEGSLEALWRSQGNKMASADARLAKLMIENNLTPEQEQHYFNLKGQLVKDLDMITALHNKRDADLSISRDLLNNLEAKWDEHYIEAQLTSIFDPRRGISERKIEQDAKFVQSQRQLVTERSSFWMHDIRVASEVSTLRANMILKDWIDGEDRGLRPEQNRSEIARLIEREEGRAWNTYFDQAKFDKWSSSIAELGQVLAGYDRATQVGYVAAKVGVMIALPGPAALGVCILINGADKITQINVRGMKADEAMRQGFWEGLTDVGTAFVFARISKLTPQRIKITANDAAGKSITQTVRINPGAGYIRAKAGVENVINVNRVAGVESSRIAKWIKSFKPDKTDEVIRKALSEFFESNPSVKWASYVVNPSRIRQIFYPAASVFSTVLNKTLGSQPETKKKDNELDIPQQGQATRNLSVESPPQIVQPDEDRTVSQEINKQSARQFLDRLVSDDKVANYLNSAISNWQEQAQEIRDSIARGRADIAELVSLLYVFSRLNPSKDGEIDKVPAAKLEQAPAQPLTANEAQRADSSLKVEPPAFAQQSPSQLQEWLTEELTRYFRGMNLDFLNIGLSTVGTRSGDRNDLLPPPPPPSHKPSPDLPPPAPPPNRPPDGATALSINLSSVKDQEQAKRLAEIRGFRRSIEQEIARAGERLVAEHARFNAYLDSQRRADAARAGVSTEQAQGADRVVTQRRDLLNETKRAHSVRSNLTKADSLPGGDSNRALQDLRRADLRTLYDVAPTIVSAQTNESSAISRATGEAFVGVDRTNSFWNGVVTTADTPASLAADTGVTASKPPQLRIADHRKKAADGQLEDRKVDLVGASSEGSLSGSSVTEAPTLVVAENIPNRGGSSIQLVQDHSLVVAAVDSLLSAAHGGSLSSEALDNAEKLIDDIEDAETPPDRRGKRRVRALADRDRRIREFIMQQLILGAFERSKRDRLLQMLRELGISEREYLDFVARLEVEELMRARQDLENESSQQEQEPLAQAHTTSESSAEVDPLSTDSKQSGAERERSELRQTSAPRVNRGELYARLRRGQA